MKHLDNIYRNRFELYHLTDGTVMDSRQTNWRDVTWEKVAKITVNLRGKIFEVSNDKPDCKGLLRFRQGGAHAIYKHGVFQCYEPIHIWTIGWTDGEVAHLQDLDFKLGRFIKEYSLPLKQLKSHIHPNLSIEV